MWNRSWLAQFQAEHVIEGKEPLKANTFHANIALYSACIYFKYIEVLNLRSGYHSRGAEKCSQ